MEQVDEEMSQLIDFQEIAILLEFRGTSVLNLMAKIKTVTTASAKQELCLTCPES
jgi:hypothetical protein